MILLLNTYHMNILKQIELLINNFLLNNYKKIYNTVSHAITYDYNTTEKRIIFGDISTNVALIIGKKLLIDPHVIAEKIKQLDFKNYVRSFDITPQGFMNIYCNEIVFEKFIENNIIEYQYTVINSSDNYNVEFVSANPTGPLHIGHGRGGIIGDVLVRVLKNKKKKITGEFYINDAGNQIEKLGHCIYYYYAQLCNVDYDFPEGGYCGLYCKDIAIEIYNLKGDLYKQGYDSFFALYAKDNLLEKIKTTLKEYGIEYDVWFSEKTLHDSGSIDEAIKILQGKNYIYEDKDDGDSKALFFRSTVFGDDKDRVVRKSSGEWTYVAADIAYLKNKIDRGYNKIVMVLGQDHHSYKIRLEAIIQALGYSKEMLHIILYQLVTVKEDGQEMKLSKRAGRIISLQEIIETVGRDCARFFYLNKKADTHLSFDIDIALQNNQTNPVYYIDYAYVRIISILKKYNNLPSDFFRNNQNNNYDYNEKEKLIIRKMIEYDKILDDIIRTYDTHLIAYYTYDLAALFHNLYNHIIFIDNNDYAATIKRHKILLVMRNVFLKIGDILGITFPDSM